MFSGIQFLHPYWLLLLGIIPFLIYWEWKWKRTKAPALRLSTLEALRSVKSARARLAKILPWMRVAAAVAFIIAMARPQATLKQEQIKADGIDIVLSTDLSSSMLAKDFSPDRLEAAKVVAADFVERRPYDRIGLVVFAAEAYTQSPLTTDHAILNRLISELRCGMLTDGTAIGYGLATAVNRVKESQAKSKVIILITDGVNNAGDYVKPLDAAQAAKEFGVKVYTIGIGTTGEAYTPIGRRANGEYVFGFAPVEIDEQLLTQIADATGGRYYRATDMKRLQEIYAEIDKLEKTQIEISVVKRYSEEFYKFLLLGVLLLIAELLLRYSVFRTLP